MPFPNTFANQSGAVPASELDENFEAAALAADLDATDAALAALDTATVKLTGNQTIAGAKTFSSVATISVGTATDSLEYFQLRPTDFGANKPYFAISKTASPEVWSMGLWDGSDAAGSIQWTSIVSFQQGIYINGSQGTVAIQPRDGTGTSFYQYNPTGDDYRISDGVNDLLVLRSDGGVKFRDRTVAQLPAAAGNAGYMFNVTDATATTGGSTVAGGGANNVLVRSNGTNWIIIN